MNKREAQRIIKAAETVKGPFPLGQIEELLERYEEAEEALQDEIDRIEGMDEIGDAMQDRLDNYNERMEALGKAKEALEAMRDSYSDFESALEDLGNLS